MATATKTIPLTREIPLAGSGGVVFPADINNDGKFEFLVLQSAGLFHAAIHGGKGNVGWDHFCLTAMDSHGNVLWRVGEPWDRTEPFVTHGGERSLCVFDLDGDGVAEVYVIRGNEVIGLRAADGKPLSAFELPYDNFVVVLPARVGTAPGDRRLLASSSNDSYDGHSHGGPTLIFDANGTIMFNRDIFGFGHDPRALDVDGDGFDEWLVGYELLDHDAKPIWKFQPCPDSEYDEEMHVDGLDTYWPRDKTRQRIAYAASTFVYVVNTDGQLQWQKELVHPQQVIYANLLPDCDEPQLFILNKRDSLQLYDFDGKELWTVMPQENWPKGRPQGLSNKFHLFDPCIKLSGVMPGGLDAICYLEGGWPYGIDGKGKRAVEFECPDSSVQEAIGNYRRPDDFGCGYQGRSYIQGGVQHVAVFERNYLWLYKL
jgi:hypothetical protein